MLKTIRKESVFQQYIRSQKYSFVLFEQIVLSKLGIILFYSEIFKFIKQNGRFLFYYNYYF